MANVFYYTHHTPLINKFKAYRFCDHLFHAVSFIQIRSYADSKVNENNLSNQIPHGDHILSPIFFCLFMNDHPKEVLH